MRICFFCIGSSQALGSGNVRIFLVFECVSWVDLSDFNSIIPCGLAGSEVTSLESELKIGIDKKEIKDKLISSFEKIFECEVKSWLIQALWYLT